MSERFPNKLLSLVLSFLVPMDDISQQFFFSLFKVGKKMSRDDVQLFPSRYLPWVKFSTDSTQLGSYEFDYNKKKVFIVLLLKSMEITEFEIFYFFPFNKLVARRSLNCSEMTKMKTMDMTAILCYSSLFEQSHERLCNEWSDDSGRDSKLFTH